jgi:transposase
MYIRKTERVYKGKTYTNHLLVESVQTAKGPRQRTICSLGSLEPAPAEDWLGLARKIESALQGQASLTAVPIEVERITRRARQGQRATASSESVISVDTSGVEIEEAREAGPVHVGHQIWRQLGLDAILTQAGLSPRACTLTEAMTLNRLICPRAEHAMPDWIRRTALSDILTEDFSTLVDEALYRNLDRLHPQRESIERDLAEREKTLFDLDDTVFLYDLTSTYFEGEARANPRAKRGYSRDQRPDCKQVVVGLVLDREGFPKAHEVFDGNRQNRESLEGMLEALEKRVGKRPGTTVIVDRGMAYDENLEQIRKRGQHYLVAGRQEERIRWLAVLESDEGWEEMVRTPSPWNPFQKKTRVQVQRRPKGEETYILCQSAGRKEKDRAIREKQEAKLLADLAKLQQRVLQGQLKDEKKVHQAIGRLRERYPRVARYYAIDLDSAEKKLGWQELAEKKTIAQKLDGSYVLRTDRQDLSAEEAWRAYILLTRVEDAFRDMKSPLMERPIFHHLKNRTQTHIFLCVLAYHLLAAIEHRFLQAGVHTSWWTLRQHLSTQQVVTVVLHEAGGDRVLKIRKATAPEPLHREIYATLRIPTEVVKPTQTWAREKDSDEKILSYRKYRTRVRKVWKLG